MLMTLLGACPQTPWVGFAELWDLIDNNVRLIFVSYLWLLWKRCFIASREPLLVKVFRPATTTFHLQTSTNEDSRPTNGLFLLIVKAWVIIVGAESYMLLVEGATAILKLGIKCGLDSNLFGVVHTVWPIDTNINHIGILVFWDNLPSVLRWKRLKLYCYQ
jgi:hypothetical protein